MSFLKLIFGFISLIQLCLASPLYTPIQPPSYPLAVRNPYLSAWLPGNEAANLPSASPQFWNNITLTWSVIARVDGQVYSLFGVPNPLSGMKPGSVQSADYTATHTTFVVEAESASFTLCFFSPVSPADYVRQSLPFSYLTVSSVPLNGATPSIQIYSDIDNSWTGQFGPDVGPNWDWALSSSSVYVWDFTPQNPALYSEVADMAQWGTAVYCTIPSSSSKVTLALGDLTTVRTRFATSGSLDASDPGWSVHVGSVFAFSHDLGSIHDMQNVTFGVGYVREQAVNYLGNAQTGFYRSATTDINSACVHFLLDYESAEAEGRALDAAISAKATSVAGPNYSDILTLSVRQAFGALDITIPESSLDTTKVMAFLKEISSNGNVNTIDVILPLSPILYVMAPDYIRLLLEPEMQYVASGQWPHNWTLHDMGSAYPNATGHNNGSAEQMPVEECGNIILLAYMYQLATGDKGWVQQYSSLFQEWAEYLVLNGLYPTIQLSSDDGTGPLANQTNLAIKAAIALNAYGEMTGQSNYSDTGKKWAKTIYEDRAGTDSAKTHFTLNEGNDTSWATEYNFFPDVLLKLNTFPADAYAMQTNYYHTVRAQAGLALDSDAYWGKTDWMHFAAAVAMAPGVENTDARNMFTNDVHTFLTNGLNTAPFSDAMIVEHHGGSDVPGDWHLYRARPVVGGHFAILALEGPNQLQPGAGQSKK